MNVSRSGRVRKKSKFLLDSEFHTPKESVIQGLSELDSKFSRSTPSSNLISVDANNEHHELSDKSELNQEKIPKADKNTINNLPQQKPRQHDQKLRQNKKKRKQGQTIQNKQKIESCTKDLKFRSNFGDNNSRGNPQKYFIVVEEITSKGTENLLFLVEEKPLSNQLEATNNLPSNRKRKKTEHTKDKISKSQRSNDKSASRERHDHTLKIVNESCSQTINCDKELQQNETIIEASDLGQSKSAVIIDDENTISGGAILISRNDGITEMSHSQETQNPQNGKSEDTLFTRVSLPDHDSSIASAVQIIAVNNDPSSSIIEGETIELVIPEGGDVRNIVTVETSHVPEIGP